MGIAVPVFDPTINIGNIVTIVIGVVTLSVAWVKLGGRLDMLEYRTTAIEKAIETMVELMKNTTENEKNLALLRQEMATTLTQHATLAATVEGLRRGEGWITARRGTVEGEYASGRN
jgi:hypothetical protein